MGVEGGARGIDRVNRTPGPTGRSRLDSLLRVGSSLANYLSGGGADPVYEWSSSIIESGLLTTALVRLELFLCRFPNT